MNAKLKIENWEIDKSERILACIMRDLSIFNFQFSIDHREPRA
jgi:hypothetical protein